MKVVPDRCGCGYWIKQNATIFAHRSGSICNHGGHVLNYVFITLWNMDVYTAYPISVSLVFYGMVTNSY